MKTTVSIIVPCYNQAQYLDEALQSVLDQTYQDWECIIVNDGSPDDTEAVAKKWLEKDKRFKYIYKQNGGLSSARNAGIAVAAGEFILPLDADDKIAPAYISLAADAFCKNPLIKLVYCKANRFGLVNGLWNLGQYSYDRLLLENMIFCSALFRKKDWKLVGGYDINMIFGWEDWDLWISILQNGGEVKCLDEICFFYRIKSTSMITELDQEKQKYSYEYLSTKHATIYIKEFGSFYLLKHAIKINEMHNKMILKSRKFVLNLFCKTFFGFEIFKNVDFKT